MNLNRFFDKARINGIEKSELVFKKTSSLDISLFHGEISNYSISNSSKLIARGVYSEKFGFCATEEISSKSYDYLIDGIKETARLVESNDETIIFEGSDKYKKRNMFNKELDNWDPNDILKVLFSFENKLKTSDEKISEVEVQFSKVEEESIFTNSFGLKLTSKSNYFVVVGSVVMKNGEEIKDAHKVVLLDNPKDLDIDKIVNEIVLDCNAKFNGISIKAGAYKAVLKQDVTATLIQALVSNLSSLETQKHSSFFEGKVGEKVLSSKLTIKELPLTKNCFYSYFDDEGVATINKVIINKGRIETLLYNLGTAKKDGVITTGNARSRGAKMGIGTSNLFVKPGRHSFDELLTKLNEGIYITSLEGLHAGLNAKSGDFSLQAEGFHIQNGKIGSPLTLFTVSGNLFKIFNNIIAIGNDSKLLLSSTTAPSIAIKGLKLSSE